MTAFPWTYRFARPGEVPIPIFEVMMRDAVFTEIALMATAYTFVVVRALLANMFP